MNTIPSCSPCRRSPMKKVSARCSSFSRRNLAARARRTRNRKNSSTTVCCKSCSAKGFSRGSNRTKETGMAIDPITVEIIRCALKAAANEMSTVLKKTAYNMMIYEVQDYCVAVLDDEGRTMSQNEGALPIFLADLGVAVQD